MRNDDKIKYWFTTEKGVHVPVKEGQSKEEALKERFSEPKFEKVGLLGGMGEHDELPEERGRSRKGKEERDKESEERRYKGVMQRVRSFEGKEEGTYDYDTGKRVDLSDGYMVTFHQNEPDKNGHYKSHYGRYTPDEYDRLTEAFVRDNNAEVYVGVFDDEPEISFKVNSFEKAKELMIKHNQKSLWNNKRNEESLNDSHDKTKNPMRGD